MSETNLNVNHEIVIHSFATQSGHLDLKKHKKINNNNTMGI